MSEAARVLAIGRTSLYRLIDSGELRVVKIGRATRVPVAELRALEGEAQRRPGGAVLPVNVQQRDTNTGTRWDVRLRDPAGRVYDRTLRTRQEAMTFERAELSARDQGQWVDPHAGRQTVADWIEHWYPVHEQGLAPNTRSQYRSTINRWSFRRWEPVASPRSCRSTSRRWSTGGPATPSPLDAVGVLSLAVERLFGLATLYPVEHWTSTARDRDVAISIRVEVRSRTFEVPSMCRSGAPISCVTQWRPRGAERH